VLDAVRCISVSVQKVWRRMGVEYRSMQDCGRKTRTHIVIDLRGIECQVQAVALDFINFGIRARGMTWFLCVAHGIGT
jgi:hypothetical protein